MFEKLGVIADIHGNAWALEAVLQDAVRRGVTRFVNLGDILYGPLRPLDTYKLLQNANVVASISGNQDRQIFEATAENLRANPTLAFVIENLGPEPIAWLPRLHATEVIDGSVFLCHGSPTSDTTYLLEDVSSGRPIVRPESAIIELLGAVRQPVILCGHTHIPRMVRLADGRLVLNPGSVGLPAYDDTTPTLHYMETHSPHASYAVLEKVPAGWNVSFHRIAYEWSDAAKQTRNLNREDWARGIQTGRMTTD
jgi:putative phosphoesterase